MATDILMPALSPGMEKGHLARWLKREGDPVKAGDVIAEVETDKATLELQASADGVLSRIMVPAGSSDVPVNQPIARLSTAVAIPAAQAPADLAAGRSAGAEAMAEPVVEQPAVPVDAEKPRRRFASPRARRLAGELRIDVATLRGSGPQGRVLERNIRDAVATAMAEPRAALAVPPLAAGAGALRAGTAAAGERLLPAKAAGGMVPIYLTSHVEVDALIELVERINESISLHAGGPPACAVALDDLLIKAWAQALTDTPGANLTFENGEAIRHDHADLAIPCSGGSAAPLLRRAESKGVAAIARERRALAARPASGAPSAEAGGTSSIASLGLPGVDGIAAGIRPPHATALALGAVEKRMVVRNDAAALAWVMTVTLSLDPRVLSPAVGGALMAALRARLAVPLRLLA